MEDVTEEEFIDEIAFWREKAAGNFMAPEFSARIYAVLEKAEGLWKNGEQAKAMSLLERI